jgi:hypothetical protein
MVNPLVCRVFSRPASSGRARISSLGVLCASVVEMKQFILNAYNKDGSERVLI